MYSSLPTFVTGFHGCDEEIQKKVLLGQEELIASDNKYDWLGKGIYFWENNPTRAMEFAEEIKDHPDRHKTIIKKPAVVGAIIDVGRCVNLLDSRYIKNLKKVYNLLKDTADKAGYVLPENKNLDEGGFSLKRNLDCAVIDVLHKVNENAGNSPYDTLRGVFVEGGRLYPDAGFFKKSHIQVCVRNPNCIKGYFNPREIVGNFQLP